jgi:hypothetical protein
MKEDSPVEHREEDEENGISTQGVKFGNEGGGLAVEKREDKEDSPVEDREEDE